MGAQIKSTQFCPNWILKVKSISFLENELIIYA